MDLIGDNFLIRFYQFFLEILPFIEVNLTIKWNSDLVNYRSILGKSDLGFARFVTGLLTKIWYVLLHIVAQRRIKFSPFICGYFGVILDLNFPLFPFFS